MVMTFEFLNFVLFVTSFENVAGPAQLTRLIKSPT
jgi:hypothetical protein